jgi:TetR/AcrR family transcriptional regulator, transcriptional repressor of aconitase
MPRVTEVYRQARRDEIAEAALRVLQRNGVADTSIAQIVEECGLSAGAIYVNFENKADLARYIASRLLSWRIETIEGLAHHDTICTPADVMRVLLGTLDGRPPLPVMLQFWGEATVNPDLHAVLTGQLDAMRTAMEHALQRWADRQVDGGSELAARVAQACIIMCQGYLANRCLFGWLTVEEYLDMATRALTPN